MDLKEITFKVLLEKNRSFQGQHSVDLKRGNLIIGFSSAKVGATGLRDFCAFWPQRLQNNS